MSVRKVNKKAKPKRKRSGQLPSAGSRSKGVPRKRTTKSRWRRPTSSWIEKRLATALKSASIPAISQYKVIRTGRWAGRCYYLDFGLPKQMVAIECDGKAYHSTKRQLAKDASRQRELEAQGWRVVRFSGSRIMTDLAGCVSEIKTLIKGT